LVDCPEARRLGVEPRRDNLHQPRQLLERTRVGDELRDPVLKREAGLHALAIGDVGQHGHEATRGTLTVEIRHKDAFDIAKHAPFALDRELKLRLTSVECLASMNGQRTSRGGGQRRLQRAGSRAGAKPLDPRAVHEHEPALGIDVGNQDRHRVRNQSELFLVPLERAFDTLPRFELARSLMMQLLGAHPHRP
jgi:hypothetical protein